MMIKITVARRTALHAAVLLCVYYFFIFNHAFKLLPYVALALAALCFVNIQIPRRIRFPRLRLKLCRFQRI